MVTGLRARVVAVSFVLALAFASRANAQANASPRVELAGDRAGLDGRKLEDLVALELGPDAARVRRVVVEVHDGRANVEVGVDDAPRTASVALADAEPERALALLIAELARGAWRTPPPLDPPAPESAPAVLASPPPETARVPASRAWQLSLLGTMGARVLTTHGAFAATPRLEVGAREEDGLRLGVTARYAHASADDPLGTVSADAFSAGLAASYVVLAGGAFAIATGPRAELGVVAARGVGAGGSSARALCSSAFWEVELHVRLRALQLAGTLEAGALRGLELRADDRDALHLSGPFVGLSVGALL